ncbi:MAG: hypothetical protein B6D56_04835 [Candidatus Omnitrophica bacterium 4484_70.1]|nr:MAG: hypothetical protein B6D56_04835 [Candidatus Omnitrophica bacterium 4484_70.1]
MDKQNQEFIAVFLTLFLLVAAYLNSLPNVFIFDDHHMIVENNYIKDPCYIPLFFKGEITSFPIARGMYRPILMLTFTFNYLINQLNPIGYHIINILIHFLNACILFFSLKLFLPHLHIWLRLGITLIFCLHPLNTEAVTYISSRSTLLSSFFILISLYTYIRFTIREDNLLVIRATLSGVNSSFLPEKVNSKKRMAFYLISIGTYILALLTKEVALIFLGLLVNYEFFSNREIFKNLRKIFLRLLPFILITLGYLLLIRSIFGNAFGLFSKHGPLVISYNRSFLSNILTQSAVSFYYLYLFLFPFHLCIDHNFPIINFPSPLGLIPLILILLLISASIIYKSKVRLIGFSLVWVWIALIPKFYARLNLVCAEHHAYLACFSLYFILGYLCFYLYPRIKPLYWRQLFFLILGLFFILTFFRNLQWRNEYTLWKSTLKVNPSSAMAYGGLGIYFKNRGFTTKAEEYFQKTVQLSDSPRIKANSLLNLATLYAFNNKPKEALKILQKNRDILMRYHSFGFSVVLGLTYLKMGERELARKIWERASGEYPENAKLKSFLGWWYLENSPPDFKKAEQYFLWAVNKDPDLALAHQGLARIYEHQNLSEAIREYHQLIKLIPSNPQPYYKLGLLYAKKLFDTRAEWYFKKAIQLAPDFAPAYYNLGVFYLSLITSDYQKARYYLNKAKSLGWQIDKFVEEALNNQKEN